MTLGTPCFGAGREKERLEVGSKLARRAETCTPRGTKECMTLGTPCFGAGRERERPEVGRHGCVKERSRLASVSAGPRRSSRDRTSCNTRLLVRGKAVAQLVLGPTKDSVTPQRVFSDHLVMDYLLTVGCNGDLQHQFLSRDKNWSCKHQMTAYWSVVRWVAAVRSQERNWSFNP